MRDLKNTLKNKYRAEVNPQFSEAAWNKFLEYESLHKKDEKKRKGLFWIFLFAAVLLSAAIIIYAFQKQELKTGSSNQDKVASSPIVLDKSEPITNLLPTSADTKKSTVITNASGFIGSASVESLKPIKILEYPGDNDEQNRSFHQNDQTSKKKNGEDLPVEIVSEDSKQLRASMEIIDVLPSISNHVMRSEYPVAMNDPILPLHHNDKYTTWSAMLYTGSGTMPYRSIKNVRQYLIQTGIQFTINDQWKIDGMIAFQRTKFTTRIQNKSLGISSVPLPRSSLNLAQVTSKTAYFEAGIGVAYEHKLSNNFRLALGSRLRYIKEIERNLSYAFKDAENGNEEIFSSLDKLNSHLYNAELHSEILYSLSNNTSIGISGSYIRSIRDSEVKLPAQWRILAGIRKRI